MILQNPNAKGIKEAVEKEEEQRREGESKK